MVGKPLPDELPKFGFTHQLAFPQGDASHGALAINFVRYSNDSGFQNRGVPIDGFLHFLG